MTGVAGGFKHGAEMPSPLARLEAALKEARETSRAKSGFLADMSHAMRTRLHAVVGLCDLILHAGNDPGESRKPVEKIAGAGMSLLGMVNDLLDISRIEAGQFEFILTDYELPSLLNDAVAQSGPRIGEKPVRFVLDIDETLPARLHGDELRIKQILNHLLSNAFKNTGEGTVELRVRCAREGDVVWLTVRVRDTGAGIRPEDMRRLFSGYAATDAPSKRGLEGVGLGLSLTKRIVELMGGSITAESEYGKGSLFTARIPQQYVSDAVLGREVAQSLKNFRHSGRGQSVRETPIRLPYARVLVVDDVLTNLDVARGLLQVYGMAVDCATNGQQAVDAVRAEKVRYNAIFMDHTMPVMDGMEAARIIREEIGGEYARTVPIIALTANAVAGNEEIFLRGGFQAVLPKPIAVADLDAVIREWVRDKKLEAELPAPRPRADGQAPRHMRSGQDRRSAPERRRNLDRRAVSEKVPGLRIKKGITRFGGDEPAFLRVLRSYATNTPPLLDAAAEPARNTLAAYAMTLHGLKGSSLGICADIVGAKAAALEKAAKAGDFNFVHAHNPAFLQAARQLVADIEQLLAGLAADAQNPKKDKPDKEALSRLLAACRNYDMDGAEAAMAEIEGYEYEADGGLAIWLRKNVDVTNFAQIKEKLSDLIT